MTPPVLPIPHPELARIVAKLWPDCARQQRVDPHRVSVVVAPSDGFLFLEEDVGDGFVTCRRPEAARALSSLADALEDPLAGYMLEIERGEGGGIRVLGWAAAPVLTMVLFYPDDGYPLCEGHMVGPDDGTATLYTTPEEAIEAHRASGEPSPLVPLSRLPPGDRRREAWEARKRAARKARAEAGRAPVGAPGSLSKGEMAAERSRGR